ncbi:MAG: cyclic pyranopterin monophosphate synthase MoaC [Actinomycetota bacterium]
MSLEQEPNSSPPSLSHLDAQGRARMVDVSGKEPTMREARAAALVQMSPKTVAAVSRGGLTKGDALGVARIAGVMGAKRTHELIPLSHPLAISHCDVTLELVEGGVAIESRVRTRDRTGVEMEALVAASCAALTLYDMCKSIEKGIVITDVRLLSKSGGKSGSWIREAEIKPLTLPRS